LTERLVATEERVETLLAQLEQTQAALAAAQAEQAPPAAAPSNGEPQPRPAYERLRTVKRGMSRAEVQRLVGEPTYVENGSGGWAPEGVAAEGGDLGLVGVHLDEITTALPDRDRELGRRVDRRRRAGDQHAVGELGRFEALIEDVGRDRLPEGDGIALENPVA